MEKLNQLKKGAPGTRQTLHGELRIITSSDEVFTRLEKIWDGYKCAQQRPCLTGLVTLARLLLQLMFLLNAIA